MNYIKY